MWGASEACNQAENYAIDLLSRAIFSDRDKFDLIRATAVTIAGIRAHGRAKSSREELEATMLKLYLERVVMDLNSMKMDWPKT
jgi:hypothetical protein